MKQNLNSNLIASTCNLQISECMHQLELPTQRIYHIPNSQSSLYWTTIKKNQRPTRKKRFQKNPKYRMKRENQTWKLETLQINQNEKRKMSSKIFISSVRRLNPRQGRCTHEQKTQAQTPNPNPKPNPNSPFQLLADLASKAQNSEGEGETYNQRERECACVCGCVCVFRVPDSSGTEWQKSGGVTLEKIQRAWARRLSRSCWSCLGDSKAGSQT